ncbi:MAG: pyridoxal phosphate-dependent aminotransferase [Candidatus Eisenbacteria sp.]|nr:pyridoxal phosphate-dependent aminotransferase [Candidatus Eisenbacteria bacterium]
MSEAGFPLSREVVDRIIKGQRIDMDRVNIREMAKVVKVAEEELGVEYIRMEIGIPGLPLSSIASQAEAEIFEEGKGSEYPPLEGTDRLRKATSRFVKMFLNVDVPWQYCVATNGAMQGGFVSQAIAGELHPDRKTILYIDPSFPVNRLQARFLGLHVDSVDLFDYRGDNLVSAIEERFRRGDVGGLLWSTPNNPSWVVLTDGETRGIGELLDRYEVIGIEDLAYICMDFRHDYSKPGQPPYPPCVGHYAENFIILLSGSKAFNYAGQRIGVSAVSPALAEKRYPNLAHRFGSDLVGEAYMKGAMYPMTAGVAQSSQNGLAALMEKACDGEYDFVGQVREYAGRAKHMKKTMLSSGFSLVYDNDLGKPLADGFYFTVRYNGLTAGDLLREMLCYGLSAIPLSVAGSKSTDGIRICVSKITPDLMEGFDYRVRRFHEDHSVAPANT